MQARLKRWGVLAMGWLFVLLGIVGLVLPVLQGVLFIVIGMLILSTEYVWAHHLVRKLLKKFPWVDQQLHRAPRWAQRWMPHWVQHHQYASEPEHTEAREHENVASERQ
jgi:uncharacterized protein